MVDVEHDMPILQLRTSLSSPIQSVLERLVVRSTQRRDLCCVPPEQVCEHVPQMLQADHTPEKGHASVLQDIDWREEPTQLFPFRQVLTLTRCPPPQLRLHPLHCPQGLHLAATVNGRRTVSASQFKCRDCSSVPLYVFTHTEQVLLLPVVFPHPGLRYS